MGFLSRKKQSLQKSRPVLTIGEDSWHYRIYTWWLNNGGEWPAHRPENLCHYMRVVLIWAAWRWFFHVRKAGRYTPAEVLFGIATIGFFSITALIIILRSPLEAFLFLLAVAGIIAGIVLSLFIEDKYEIFSRFFDWFFNTSFKTVVRPVTVTIAIVLAIGAALIGFDKSLTILIFLTEGAIGILIAFGIVLIASKLIKFLNKRFPVAPYTPKPKKEGVSTPKLLWEFTVASKNRFMCPIINTPNLDVDRDYNPLGIRNDYH